MLFLTLCIAFSFLCTIITVTVGLLLKLYTILIFSLTLIRLLVRHVSLRSPYLQAYIPLLFHLPPPPNYIFLLAISPAFFWSWEPCITFCFCLTFTPAQLVFLPLSSFPSLIPTFFLLHQVIDYFDHI